MNKQLTPIQEYFANQQRQVKYSQISNEEIYALLKQIQKNNLRIDLNSVEKLVLI